MNLFLKSEVFLLSQKELLFIEIQFGAGLIVRLRLGESLVLFLILRSGDLCFYFGEFSLWVDFNDSRKFVAFCHYWIFVCVHLYERSLRVVMSMFIIVMFAHHFLICLILSFSSCSFNLFLFEHPWWCAFYLEGHMSTIFLLHITSAILYLIFFYF